MVANVKDIEYKKEKLLHIRDTKSSVMAKRIVILCLSLIFSIAIVITAVSLISLVGITDRDMHTTTELTMSYLNEGVLGAILPAIDVTNSLAAIASQIQSYDELEKILPDLMATVPSVFEMYYGTALSRFDGGFFATATSWTPYGDSPQWD